MFGKKKKNPREYDDYEDYEEDDYDYEEDDYEEDDYEEDDYEENYQPKSPKKRSNPLEKENQSLLKEISHLESKLHILEIREGQSSPEVEKQLQRLNRTVDRLQGEVESKQKEVDQLTNKLLDNRETNEQTVVLENKVQEMEKKNQELRMQFNSETELRASIADVMIDAKDSSKQIINRAEFQAEQIIKEAKMNASKMVSNARTELGMIKKDASDYYKQLDYTKEEASDLFEQLLKKLVILKDF